MTSKQLLHTFNTWKLAHNKLLSFPLDPVKENYIRLVPNALFSVVEPTPLDNVKLVGYSISALEEILNLKQEVVEDENFIDFMSGNMVVKESPPLAHRYGGHQFGVWANQLGDGRAIILGAYENHKKETWEIQLKGAGMTPYSRGADGRAVVRSSVREFLCSEAMHFLGIPSSRAATLIISDEQVIRDKLYMGQPEKEYIAVVSRLAPSWIRFGSFEILSKHNELTLLRKLTNYVIEEFFPGLSLQTESSYLEFLQRVVIDNAELVSGWQSVGFTHGVLNTDNMSILGITIDYGPFGMMENYRPCFTPNYSDKESRYCYSEQPAIVKWNLRKLGESLQLLLSPGMYSEVDNIINSFDSIYRKKWLEKFMLKLGFPSSEDSDMDLINKFLSLLKKHHLDFTMSFRELGEHTVAQLESTQMKDSVWALSPVLGQADFNSFLKSYREKLESSNISESQRQKIMNEHNPRYILKNWIAEKCIKGVLEGDYSILKHLVHVLKNPFAVDEKAEANGYSSPSPKWSQKLKISCSS